MRRGVTFLRRKRSLRRGYASHPGVSVSLSPGLPLYTPDAALPYMRPSGVQTEVYPGVYRVVYNLVYIGWYIGWYIGVVSHLGIPQGGVYAGYVASLVP